MLPEDSLDLHLKEAPGHSIEQAFLTARTEHLTATALLDDVVPGAGEAELVINVARALDKVGVLQFEFAIFTLSSPDIIICFIQISEKLFRYLKVLKIFLL